MKTETKSKDNKKYKHTSKDILKYLLIGGALTTAVVAPQFITPAILLVKFQKNGYTKRKFQNTFYYLKQNGYIKVRFKNGNIVLTDKGRKMAKKDNILTKLSIKKPKKWDKKWRLIIFDIGNEHNIKRDALRKMLSKIGFIYLQKSIFIYPFECGSAVNLLKEFFELNDDELRLITASSIGNDNRFRKIFKI